MSKPLEGKVALVAGATRGAGRGVAVELGAAGATVYCTGRSGDGQRSPEDRPETIEETAEFVSLAGGKGIPIRVDHMRVDQVRDLVRRIVREQDGRIDILVNAIWGGNQFAEDWQKPFWEHDLEPSLAMVRNAVDTHIITAWHVAPLMKARGTGLIVGLTDCDPDMYHDYLFYDLAKKSVMRLAVAFKEELGPFGVTGIAVSPGYLRSELALERHGVTEETWQDAFWRDRKDLAWLTSESPRYTGRAVVALATDPDVMRWSGRTAYAFQLAGHYGFTDVDGTRPGHGIYSLDHVRTHELRREDYLS